MRKLTTGQHIIQSIDKFGPDRFDYSETSYVTAKKNCTYFCLWHKEPIKVVTFPDNHLNIRFGGCTECSRLSKFQGTEQHEYSLALSNIKKHFDHYKHLIYQKSSSKISFTCITHGEQSEPVLDFHKYQCKQCRVEEREQEFWASLTPELHELYIYPKKQLLSHLPLSSRFQSVSAICRKHKECFTHGLNRHLHGQSGCQSCIQEKKSKTRKKTHLATVDSKIESFKDNVSAYEALDEYYTYPDLEKEISEQTKKITVVCRKHPDKPFKVIKEQHKFRGEKRGHGCPECKREKLRQDFRTPFEDVKKRFQEVGLVVQSKEEEYTNQDSLLSSNCQNCGSTEDVRVSNVFRPDTKTKCPNCARFARFGVQEDLARKILESYFSSKFPVDHITDHPDYNHLELDGHSLQLNMAFEYQGPTHYKPIHGDEALRKQQTRDQDKAAHCHKLGIQLLVIRHFEVRNGVVNASGAIDNIREAFENIGLTVDDSVLTEELVLETYGKVCLNPRLLEKLDEFCSTYNLKLLSERIYRGVDHKQTFECNKCGHVFKNYCITQLKGRGVLCSCRKVKRKKRPLPESLQKEKLKQLYDRIFDRGIFLLSQAWVGSKPNNLYSGLCLHCEELTHFKYSTAAHASKPLCKCQHKSKGYKRTESKQAAIVSKISSEIELESNGLFRLESSSPPSTVKSSLIIEVTTQSVGFNYIKVGSHDNWRRRGTYRKVAHQIRNGESLNPKIQISTDLHSLRLSCVRL